jgi:hypothetical protein
MKGPLLMATVVGVGFLAGLGIAAVRGDLSRPSAAAAAAAVPLQAAPATDAVPLQSEPQPDGRESADSLPAPTYDQETAARDRAAAHSARSR